MILHLSSVLTAYIVTVVICAGSIFIPLRQWVKTKFPMKHEPHFIECRLCVGAWVSFTTFLLFYYCTDTWINPLLIWGGSYFLATQER